MKRILASVVVGYLTMVVVVMAIFALFCVLGVFGPDPQNNPELPGTWWLIAILAVSEVGAALGGYLTTRISRAAHPQAILSLMTLMLFMWVISSFGDTQEPLLFRFGNLVAGLVGLLVGWKVCLRRNDFASSSD